MLLRGAIILFIGLYLSVSSYAQDMTDKLEIYVSFYTESTVTVNFINNGKDVIKFKPELILNNVVYERYVNNQIWLPPNGMIMEVFKTTEKLTPTPLSKYKLNLEMGCQGVSANCVVYTKEILYKPSTPLPITLSKFNVQKKGMYNLLEWETASERNADAFVIERSDNGKDFSSIAKLKASGHSDIKRQYSFNDYFPSATPIYYRLKQIDTDGSHEFSKIVTINASTQPVSYFGFSIDYDETPISFIVFDSKGNITKDFKAPLKESELDFDKGLNIIVLITNKDRYSRKVIQK
jgi:hypothetical protein